MVKMYAEVVFQLPINLKFSVIKSIPWGSTQFAHIFTQKNREIGMKIYEHRVKCGVFESSEQDRNLIFAALNSTFKKTENCT